MSNTRGTFDYVLVLYAKGYGDKHHTTRERWRGEGGGYVYNVDFLLNYCTFATPLPGLWKPFGYGNFRIH